MSGTTVITKPLAVRKKSAAAMIGCGKTKLEEMIAAGTIKALKSEKQVLITMAELERHIASLPPATLKLPHRRIKNTEAA